MTQYYCDKEIVQSIQMPQGYKVLILPDEDGGENPLLNQQGPKGSKEKATVLMVTWHRKVGNNQGFKEAPDALEFASEHGFHVFPIRMYDHGSQSYYLSPERVDSSALFPSRDTLAYPFNDRWDSGWLGYLLVSNRWDGAKHTTLKATLIDLLDDERRKLAYTFGQSCLSEYSYWASGEVYGFIVRDAEGKMVDSCYRYFGQEAAVEAGKESAEGIIARLTAHPNFEI